MKKLFVMSCAALALAACTSEEENSLLGGDSSKQNVNLKEVSAITRGMGDGSMNVASARKAGNDMSVVYVQKDQDKEVGRDNLLEVDNNISWKYVNVICNKGTGFFHGENGWAVKNSAAGTLDNNRKTYSWFVNEQGAQQSIEPNDQGLLLTGSNCNLSGLNKNGGKRAIVSVGDEWFDNSFDRAQQFIDAALATEGTVVNYGGQNPGQTSNYTYTEYSYEGYKVIVVDQTYFQNGSVAGSNDQAKAPWCWGHWNTFANDNNQETIDHNVVIVPTSDITFDGRYMDCHIFAPGKKVSLLNGACPSGLVICDELVTSSEIHGTWTPEFPGSKDPEPGEEIEDKCEANLLIDLGIDAQYIVIADDFAIQNGDKLYMNAAIEGQEHAGVVNGVTGENAYVFVEKGDGVQIKVDDICSLYPSYVGKVDNDGIPYINEVGELTLVVYLWPGILNEAGNFVSHIFENEGYIIGEENEPVSRYLNSEDYNVKVSAYVGRQGVGEKADGTYDEKGWSYVKVSIHIAPKAKAEIAE